MSHEIPSKLIIYRSHRFALSRQNNIKYGFFSPKLLYSANKSPKELRKRITDLPKKDYINMISYSLTPVKHKYNYFMRFITRISSIKRLSLTLLPVNFQSSNSEQVKVLKKILKICSRAEKLHISIMPRSLKTQLSFKYLNLVKYYKNFTCSLWNARETPFEKFANHLLHTRSQRTNSFRLVVNPDSLLERTFDFDSFSSSLEIFDSNAQNLSLLLRFTPKTNMDSFFSFAQKVSNLQSLIELALEIELSEGLVKTLNIIKENKSLKDLRLTVTPPQTPDPILPKLNNLNFESLTSLDLTFERFENIPFFSALVGQFTLCNNQLSSFHVSLQRSEGLTDSVLSALIGSLANLKDKLESFYFQAREISTKLTAAKVIDFYTQIAALKHLKVLGLDLPAPKEEEGSEETFGVLCECLKSLTQLHFLHLNMASKNDQETSIVQLANTLPNLVKIEVLKLNFTKPVSVKGFNQLLKGMTVLKNLSSLVLEVKCSGVDENCVRELVSEFSGLRGLNYLQFYLEITPYNASIREYLRQNMLQVERKIEAITSVNVNISSFS